MLCMKDLSTIMESKGRIPAGSLEKVYNANVFSTRDSCYRLHPEIVVLQRGMHWLLTVHLIEFALHFVEKTISNC